MISDISYHYRFLWVSLQVLHLEACAPDEVLDVLNSLPTGLDETYCRILKRFRPVRSSLPRVRFILGFIAFACRPLTVDEVTEALSFDFTSMRVKSSDGGNTATEADLLRALPGLIDVKDSGSKRIVQFIHFSVKEYLTSGTLRRDESISEYSLDRHLADASIAALSLTALKPDHESSPALGNLKRYATEHWYEHVSPEGERDKPKTSDHSHAKELQDAIERLNNALFDFLHLKSSGYMFWRGHIIRDRYHWATSTPLHCAVFFAMPAQTKRLLEQGADVNIFSHGQTPLQYSLNSEANPCTEALLNSGANPDLTLGDECTPLHLAITKGYAATVRTLLHSGADPWARTTRARVTPLHIAIKSGRADICEILLTQGAGLGNVPDRTGQTPLHYAVYNDQPQILEMLLRNGANASITDRNGETALSLARRHAAGGQHVRLLEEYIGKKLSDSMVCRIATGVTVLATVFDMMVTSWESVNHSRMASMS